MVILIDFLQLIYMSSTSLYTQYNKLINYTLRSFIRWWSAFSNAVLVWLRCCSKSDMVSDDYNRNNDEWIINRFRSVYLEEEYFATEEYLKTIATLTNAKLCSCFRNWMSASHLFLSDRTSCSCSSWKRFRSFSNDMYLQIKEMHKYNPYIKRFHTVAICTSKINIHVM